MKNWTVNYHSKNHPPLLRWRGFKTINMTYTEHLRRTEALRNTTYIRRNGKGYRLVNGNLIPEAEFQAANKLPVRLYMSKLNPCKKHEYLDA
jgi:hypothetical protein